MGKKKIDKDFVLSDSSINVYGFRLRTEGCVMEEVLKNPIGYYGHDAEEGVLLLWDEVRVDGDRILGKPVINLQHPRADRTITEIEQGFLNAASVGNICLLEWELEDNPADPENPTVVGTRWYYKECSLVDSPGNRNAFKLYDKDDNELKLPDLKDSSKIFSNKNKTSDMREIQLKITPQLVGFLNLSDDADNKEVQKAIKDLYDRAKAGDTAITENTTLKTELQDLKDTQTANEVTAILEKGLADKKLTVELKDKLAADYAKNPKGLKDLVDTMPAHVSIVDKIAAANKKDVTDLKDKSWDELDREGTLQNLKDNDFEGFKVKYQAKFGKEWKG